MKERIKSVLNFRKPSQVIIVATVVLIAVALIIFSVNYVSIGRNFSMQGANLSDLQPDEVVRHIVQITGANDDNILVPSDNFQLQVSDSFDWMYSETISMIISKNSIAGSRYYGCQLHIFPYVKKFFISASQKQELPQQQYYLRDYLDALKYLPQEHIRSLTHDNPDMYIINFVDDGIPADNQPCVFYNMDGLIGNSVWNIRLDIQPMYKDEEGPGHHGVGSDVIHVFYGVYEVRKWLDYYLDEQMPWERCLELTLPEYPNTIFQWTPYAVKAIIGGNEKILFDGMPIWNVYLADLNGDGLPEFCATVSFGSGIIDERIIVYDCANDKLYELSDRGYFDYVLSLINGRLTVKQTRYPNPKSDILATGELAIIDGNLTAIGIDRVKPNPMDALLSSWTPLADLPADYSKEQAAADGVYVNIHGIEVYNQDTVNIFHENVTAGIEAFMRVMQYTTEGDAVITDYRFDGETFTVAHDSTRDKFSAPDDRIISTATYKYLVLSTHSEAVPKQYYLSNEQNIFTGTNDGDGSTLIDGLCLIPSPSKN